MLQNTIFFNPDYSDYSTDFDLLSMDLRQTPDISNAQCNFDAEHNNSNKVSLTQNHCQRLMEYARQKTKDRRRSLSSDRALHKKSSEWIYNESNVLRLLSPKLRQAIQPLLIPYKCLRLYDIVGKGIF